jgi:hypothetical protein
MSDQVDEDADLRSSLAALGADALRELHDVLTWPQPSRDALLRSLVGRPGSEPLAQLIAIADTDKVARLRLLRALRGLHQDFTGEASPLVLPKSRYRPIGGRDSRPIG